MNTRKQGNVSQAQRMMCTQENTEIRDPKEHKQKKKKKLFCGGMGSDEGSENSFLKLFQAHAEL